MTDISDASLEEARIAHLAAVVDASSDAILSKSLDGTIRTWNASAARIFGYSAEEMVGRNIRLLIPDERQAEEDEILARLRQGDYIEHYETVRLTKDGRPLDVSLSISPIRDSSGRITGASKIIRDISSRRQSEEALAAANAKFESVFNQSGIFAGILDPDGSVRDINALAIEACGYTRAEVLGLAFWDTPWWRGSDEVRGRIRFAAEQAAAGEVFRETLPYWVADGSERVVEFVMHPIRRRIGRGAVPPPDRDRCHRPRRGREGPAGARSRGTGDRGRAAASAAPGAARHSPRISRWRRCTRPAATCSRSEATGTTPSSCRTGESL